MAEATVLTTGHGRRSSTSGQPGRRRPSPRPHGRGGSIGESRGEPGRTAFLAGESRHRPDRLYEVVAAAGSADRSPSSGETVVAFLTGWQDAPDLALSAVDAGLPHLRLWDVESGKELRSFLADRNSRMRSVSAPHRQSHRSSAAYRLWTWRQVKAGTNSPSPCMGLAVPGRSVHRDDQLGGARGGPLSHSTPLGGPALSPDAEDVGDRPRLGGTLVPG